MLERLWLEAFQRLADRAAHEVKNPLNGIAVNLEVVRRRAARGGADAASLVPFAETAAEELQRATELVDSLLTLARPARGPVDLWLALQPLVRLRAAIAAADGGVVTAERSSDAALVAAVDGVTVRLALATALEAVSYGGAHVRCTVTRHGDVIEVDLRGSEPVVPLAEPVCATIAAGGVELRYSPDGITLGFPASANDGPHTM
jgi:signal transduction histidine kinase